MANRKRNIQIKFWVTEEEKQLIEEKMAQLQTKRIGAYLRKMAIDGYIIQVDTTDIKEMTRALSAIGRNINQIAKRLNAGGSAYQADMEEIRERMDQIYPMSRSSWAKASMSPYMWGFISSLRANTPPFFSTRRVSRNRARLSAPVMLW